jgi:hypothetical protein
MSLCGSPGGPLLLPRHLECVRWLRGWTHHPQGSRPHGSARAGTCGQSHPERDRGHWVCLQEDRVQECVGGLLGALRAVVSSGVSVGVLGLGGWGGVCWHLGCVEGGGERGCIVGADMNSACRLRRLQHIVICWPPLSPVSSACPRSRLPSAAKRFQRTRSVNTFARCCVIGPWTSAWL